MSAPRAVHDVGRYAWPLAMTALGLVLWQVIVTQFNIADYLIPPPTDVAAALVEDRALLLENAWVTAQEMLLGFGLALCVGWVVALGLHLSPLARRAVYPLLIVSQSIPVIVMAPVLVIVLGFGILPKLVIVAIICFFPIAVNTLDGLGSVDPSMRGLMLSLYGTRWSILRRIEIPAALPMAFTGARIAATYAAIGAIFGEWSGAAAGVGYLIQQSMASLATTQMFAGLVVLCFMSFALVGAVTVLERIVVPWAPRVARSSR